ncbi:unnamed protein product [Discosporangium mesarthrocarpum]
MAFRLLKLDNAYVCNAGRLVGVVTRDSLTAFVGTRERTPMEDCMSLCGAMMPGGGLGKKRLSGMWSASSESQSRNNSSVSGWGSSSSLTSMNHPSSDQHVQKTAQKVFSRQPLHEWEAL